jgi:tungstate transport system substrate-binding protein
MRKFRLFPRIVALVSALTLLSCGLPVSALAASKSIILATTTSIPDSGLLDVLIPLFEKETGYIVRTINVGSGQAMVLGQRGEVDTLLVHSPGAQKKFMAEGAGSSSRLVMHNDFILVGPTADPAREGGSKTIAEALRKIAAGKGAIDWASGLTFRAAFAVQSGESGLSAPAVNPGGRDTRSDP